MHNLYKNYIIIYVCIFVTTTVCCQKMEVLQVTMLVDLRRFGGLFNLVVDLRGLLDDLNFLRGSPRKDCGSVGGGRIGF